MIRRENIDWQSENQSFRLSGLDFVSAHWDGSSDDWAVGENCFRILKTRALIEQYLKYFNELSPRPSFANLVELGVYDGGSVPFWLELLQPKRHLAIELKPEPNLSYFRKYLIDHGFEDRVDIRWQTDTTDRAAVIQGLRDHFGASPIDIVIDDASHRYAATRTSFEILFPLLRPRGLYIIEDWAWFHWKGIEDDWQGEKPTTDLITLLVEASGSSRVDLVESLHVCNGFVVVRRGYASAEELDGFSLDQFIYRHPR